MSRTTSARGRYAWVTVPASFYFELHGAAHDPEMEKFNFRVGGRIVEETPSGGLLLDIDAYEDAAGHAAPLLPRPGVKPIPGEKISRVDLVAQLGDGDPTLRSAITLATKWPWYEMMEHLTPICTV